MIVSGHIIFKVYGKLYMDFINRENEGLCYIGYGNFLYDKIDLSIFTLKQEQ